MGMAKKRRRVQGRHETLTLSHTLPIWKIIKILKPFIGTPQIAKILKNNKSQFFAYALH